MDQLALFEKKDIRKKNNYEAQSYTGIYALHKYWSKKPYNIIRKFITRYSKTGEIVLDPFCGSGISIIEAIITNRKAIGFDINPISIFITEQLLNKIPTQKLLLTYQKLKSSVKEQIDGLYKIKRNGEEFTGTHFIWEQDELLEIWYQERNGKGTKIIDFPTSEDKNLAQSFTYNEIPYYYPQKRFFHNPRINAYRDKHIYDLFTPRNLLGLSILLHAIERIEDINIKNLFKFVFTSSVGQASKMVFIVKRRGKYKNNNGSNLERKEVGSWVIGYWVPKENFEINVWNCFENKFRKTLKAKSQQYSKSYQVKKADHFIDLLDDKNLLLINSPSQKALKNIPDESVDYVITDPPHGNRQPYLELSMMWNDWLKFDVNYDDEIIISESKDRHKDVNDYFELLNTVLEEIVRILKPDRYFSLMFNSLDDETWLNLIQKMNELNVVLYKVETLGYSANSVVQDTREKGLKTDFIITFKKVQTKIHSDLELVALSSERTFIIELINDYLSQTIDEQLETYQIFNLLFSDLLHSNKFIKLTDIIKILEHDFQKNGNRWGRKI
jgi:DNA modification methylase